MNQYSTETLEDMAYECDLRLQNYNLSPEKQARALALREKIEAELERREK